MCILLQPGQQADSLRTERATGAPLVPCLTGVPLGIDHMLSPEITSGFFLDCAFPTHAQIHRICNRQASQASLLLLAPFHKKSQSNGLCYCSRSTVFSHVSTKLRCTICRRHQVNADRNDQRFCNPNGALKVAPP